MREWHEVNNEWLRLPGDWLMENAETYGGVHTKNWFSAAAQRFGVTVAWIATLYSSDAFRDYFQRRLQAGEKPRNNYQGSSDKITRRKESIHPKSRRTL
jgi:hypothetical protein